MTDDHDSAGETAGETIDETIDETAGEATTRRAQLTDRDETLTLADAAKQCTVSKTTLRRRLHADQIRGATRADDGSWSIPTASLALAGLLPSSQAPYNAEPKPVAQSEFEPESKPTSKPNPSDIHPSASQSLRVNIAKPGPRTPPPVLEVELTTLRHRAELAEQQRDAARSELERADQVIRNLRRNTEVLERLLPPPTDHDLVATESESRQSQLAQLAASLDEEAFERTIEKLRTELAWQRRATERANALASAGWRERRRLRKQSG